MERKQGWLQRLLNCSCLGVISEPGEAQGTKGTAQATARHAAASLHGRAGEQPAAAAVGSAAAQLTKAGQLSPDQGHLGHQYRQATASTTARMCGGEDAQQLCNLRSAGSCQQPAQDLAGQDAATTACGTYNRSAGAAGRLGNGSLSASGRLGGHGPGRGAAEAKNAQEAPSPAGTAVRCEGDVVAGLGGHGEQVEQGCLLSGMSGDPDLLLQVLQVGDSQWLQGLPTAELEEQEGTSAADAALVTYAAPGPTSQETRSSACTTAAGAFGSAAALAALDDERAPRLASLFRLPSDTTAHPGQAELPALPTSAPLHSLTGVLGVFDSQLDSLRDSSHAKLGTPGALGGCSGRVPSASFSGARTLKPLRLNNSKSSDMSSFTSAGYSASPRHLGLGLSSVSTRFNTGPGLGPTLPAQGLLTGGAAPIVPAALLGSGGGAWGTHVQGVALANRDSPGISPVPSHPSTPVQGTGRSSSHKGKGSPRTSGLLQCVQEERPSLPASHLSSNVSRGRPPAAEMTHKVQLMLSLAQPRSSGSMRKAHTLGPGVMELHAWSSSAPGDRRASSAAAASGAHAHGPSSGAGLVAGAEQAGRSEAGTPFSVAENSCGAASFDALLTTEQGMSGSQLFSSSSAAFASWPLTTGPGQAFAATGSSWATGERISPEISPLIFTSGVGSPRATAAEWQPAAAAQRPAAVPAAAAAKAAAAACSTATQQAHPKVQQLQQQQRCGARRHEVARQMSTGSLHVQQRGGGAGASPLADQQALPPMPSMPLGALGAMGQRTPSWLARPPSPFQAASQVRRQKSRDDKGSAPAPASAATYSSPPQGLSFSPTSSLKSLKSANAPALYQAHGSSGPCSRQGSWVRMSGPSGATSLHLSPDPSLSSVTLGVRRGSGSPYPISPTATSPVASLEKTVHSMTVSGRLSSTTYATDGGPAEAALSVRLVRQASEVVIAQPDSPGEGGTPTTPTHRPAAKSQPISRHASFGAPAMRAAYGQSLPLVGATSATGAAGAATAAPAPGSAASSAVGGPKMLRSVFLANSCKAGNGTNGTCQDRTCSSCSVLARREAGSRALLQARADIQALKVTYGRAAPADPQVSTNSTTRNEELQVLTRSRTKLGMQPARQHDSPARNAGQR